jgi:hypothetical protein
MASNTLVLKLEGSATSWHVSTLVLLLPTRVLLLLLLPPLT